MDGLSKGKAAMNIIKNRSVFLLFFCFLAPSSNGFSAEFTVETGGVVIEEITVTARKREERLQDVPIAISAFSENQIRDASVTNLDQIAPLTPGLTFGKFNESRPQIYIRGVGSRQFDVGSESSVGIFIDEVYQGRFSSGLSGLNDVARIEVLKGPQGTLYGRNTIGGAINIITNKPTDVLGFDAEVGLGNLDYSEGKMVINVPVIESMLNGRLAISYEQRDGYIKNLTTGTMHNALGQLDVRGSLVYTPTSNIDVLLTWNYNYADPDAGLQGEYVAGLPVLGTGGPLAPAVVKTPSRFNEYYNTDSRFRRKITNIMLRADWNLGNVALTSISGFGHTDLAERRDLDSLRIDAFEHITDENSRQFTQEFRLSSTNGGVFTFDDRVNWVVGMFYLKEKPDRLENLRGGKDSLFSMIAASIDHGGPAAPVVPGEMYIDNFLAVDVNTTSYAAFGQATVNVTEKLELTIGGRYTKDRKKAIYSGTSNHDYVPPIILPFTVKLDERWSSFNPKVTIAYHWSDNLLTYFDYSEGFKSGGFQFAKFNAVDASRTFDPETVDTYEIGLKSEWFDRALQVNANYFYYKYSDMQVPKNSGADSAPTITTENAAKATIRGLELEGVFRVTDGLTLQMGYAYLDAKYDSYVFTSTVDFSGNRMTRSPKHTVNLTTEYVWSLGGGELRLRGDASWTGKFYFEADEGHTPGTDQSAYTLINARASYARDAWRVSLWGKNLTNRTYRTTTVSFDAFTVEYLDLPRTYGLTVGWGF